MSGSAGLSLSRNPKAEGSTLSGYARNLKKGCAGLVAGPVLTAEITWHPQAIVAVVQMELAQIGNICSTLVMASLYRVRTRPVFLYRALIGERRSDPNPSNRPNNRLGENPSGPPRAPRRSCRVQRATPLDFPASLRGKSISRPSTSSENSHSFP